MLARVGLNKLNSSGSHTITHRGTCNLACKILVSLLIITSVLLVITLITPEVRGEELSAPFSVEELSSSYLHLSLSSARRWMKRLENENLEGIDRHAVVEALVEEFTWLLEVAKIPQARTHLENLLSTEEEALTRYGFSKDGSLAINVTRMLLKNPAYSNYTLMLIRIENRTPFVLRFANKWNVRTHLVSGEEIAMFPLTKKHPLFPKLKKIAKTFSFPVEVSEGGIASFNLISDGKFQEKDIAYINFNNSSFNIMVKFYENIKGK